MNFFDHKTVHRFLAWSVMALMSAAVWAANTVPTDIKLPGTQQLEVPTYTSPDNCDNCHGGYDQAVEPAFLWRGGMMANALRDGLFWATVAVAEQDFIPGADPATRGGAGDLCIRCHSVNGWMAGRSTPTDGSGLSNTADINGVECEFCHLMVDPDQPLSIAGTTEVQNFPFEAYDATDTYRGAAQYVINGNGTRLGPYITNPPHAVIQSPFHRKTDLCATCHDVSNPAVGDLAHNNGAQAGMALAPGTFSGVLGAAVDGKAAFNNPPHEYGIVERTYSEWVASGLDTLVVNDFNTLPADLKVVGGALQVAYNKAYAALSTPITRTARCARTPVRLAICPRPRARAATRTGSPSAPTSPAMTRPGRVLDARRGAVPKHQGDAPDGGRADPVAERRPQRRQSAGSGDASKCGPRFGFPGREQLDGAGH